MDEKISSAWLRVSVTAVEQGATYEGRVYDQDLVVRMADGEVWTLFNMAPMIAVGIQAGEVLDVILAISTPANLKREGTTDGRNSAMIDSIDYQPSREVSATFRAELFERQWCRLKTSTGHFLMAITEIVSHFPQGIAPGESLSWEDGRLDLMAWKRPI